MIHDVPLSFIDRALTLQYTTEYMIAVKMMGRLGNQMFQYACAYAVAQHNATTIMLDTSHIAFMPAFFLLDHLNVTGTYTCFGIPSVQYRRIIEGIKRRTKHMPFITHVCDNTLLQIRFHTHVLDSFCYDAADIARPFNAGNRVYLDGYFQSFKYFHGDVHISEALRSQFTLKHPLSPYSTRVLAHIKSTPHPVAIHIRRTDYVEDGFDMPSIASYYIPAMTTMKKKLNTAFTVFVFSDDIPWAKEHLSGACDVPVHVVDGNTAENCYEDMYLISQCEHQIIANSTFSWWGAWLNTNPDKIVIAPKLWLGNRYPVDAIIPPQWIRV